MKADDRLTPEETNKLRAEIRSYIGRTKSSSAQLCLAAGLHRGYWASHLKKITTCDADTANKIRRAMKDKPEGYSPLHRSKPDAGAHDRNAEGVEKYWREKEDLARRTGEAEQRRKKHVRQWLEAERNNYGVNPGSMQPIENMPA